MRNALQILGCVVVAAALAVTARAEVVRPGVRFTAAVTNVWTVGSPLIDRGILHKLEISLSGTAKTGDVWIADEDGSLVYSNTLASGSTFYITNCPVVGLVIKTQNATTNALTVNVRATLEK